MNKNPNIETKEITEYNRQIVIIIFKTFPSALQSSLLTLMSSVRTILSFYAGMDEIHVEYL
jgi:hypothetical protein